jgi:predicted DNA-binding protein
MARSTTSLRLPVDLIEALDERAAALGVTRSQLISEAVDEMMEAIRDRRSRSEPPDL